MRLPDRVFHPVGSSVNTYVTLNGENLTNAQSEMRLRWPQFWEPRLLRESGSVQVLGRLHDYPIHAC